MDQIEIISLAFGAIAAASLAIVVGQGSGGHGYWAWGLACIAAAGACYVAAGSQPVLDLASAALISAYPFCMLAGAYTHVGRRSPLWLLPAAVAFGIVRVSMTDLRMTPSEQILGLFVEPIVLLSAAFVMRETFRTGPTVVQRLVPLAMVAAATAAAIQQFHRIDGSREILWLAWLSLGIPAVSLVVLDAYQRSKDTTSRVREDLEKSLARFDAIANSAFDLIIELDSSLKVRWVSPSVTKVHGHAPHEMLGRPGADFLHPDDLAISRQNLGSPRDGGSTALPPVRVRARDGEWRWVEGTVRRFVSGSEVRFALVARDVTERIATEAALLESQNRLERLGEHSRDVFGEINGGGHLVYVSPNIERMFGFAPSELLGLSVRETAMKLRAEAIDQLAPVLERMDAEGGLDRLTLLHHKDGRRLWVETYLNAYDAPDGERHAIAVTRDVTGRVLIEDGLRAAQKLESLALLAGGIAHDFNNALMSIFGNVAILQERIDARAGSAAAESDLELRPVVAEIEAAADRASSLTRQLLSYAGRGELRRQLLNLSDLAREVVRLIERTLPEGATLDVKLSEAVPVTGDDSRLRQAILVLIANAREALPAQGGRISISTGIADLDRDSLRPMELGNPMREGEYAYLEVRDEGHGMDAATRARIFDPFFTTKRNGRGLGLANLLGIARSHDATIAVQSEPGRGTCMRLYFPLADVETVALEPAPAPSLDPDWRGSGTILVVDDEEAIRRLGVRALTGRGFTVLTAADGHEAVDLYRRHADEIRLVVMDVVMPEMRGDEAYLAMREFDPDVRVLLSSGYGVDEFLDRIPADAIAGFLHKPYRHETLLRRIREILEPQ